MELTPQTIALFAVTNTREQNLQGQLLHRTVFYIHARLLVFLNNNRLFNGAVTINELPILTPREDSNMPVTYVGLMGEIIEPTGIVVNLRINPEQREINLWRSQIAQFLTDILTTVNVPPILDRERLSDLVKKMAKFSDDFEDYNRRRDQETNWTRIWTFLNENDIQEGAEVPNDLIRGVGEEFFNEDV